MPTQTFDKAAKAAPDPPDIRLQEEIRLQAKALGFDAIGFTGADAPADHWPHLTEFLEKGYHGTMDWMATRAHHRASPKALWPDCQSVIMLAMTYGPDGDPRHTLDQPDKATISVYARGDDYHDIIKKRLKSLARWLVERSGCQLKVFVDTAPVPEKRLAELAGLGWQGKHTNLVSTELGNWFFLGAIYTSINLPIDSSDADHCGSCRACLDACPTKAFPAPYKLDARRCISYLTIEHKGPWPEEFRTAMGNRIYGCDDCLAACPWNKFAVEASEAKLQARPDLKAPDLADLLTLDDAGFRARFRKNPIKRIGLKRFQRNILYAMGNSGNRAFVASIKPYTKDEDQVVADAARWALMQLEAQR